MEYLDILNSDGTLTGEHKDRNQVHIDGNWHRAVHIWIINSKNQVLLQKRSELKKLLPNKWDVSVAGHIVSGETSLNTAIIEIKEELGLHITEKELSFIAEMTQEGVFNHDTYIDNEYVDVYLLKKDINIEKIKKQKTEVADVRWIELNKFKRWVEEKPQDLCPKDRGYQLLFETLNLK